LSAGRISDAVFDYADRTFGFSNGLRESLMANQHLPAAYAMPSLESAPHARSAVWALLLAVTTAAPSPPGVPATDPPAAPTVEALRSTHPCARYHQVSLNIMLDYSGSMGGWRFDLARGFALDVLHALEDAGRLQRSGGVGFPFLPGENGFAMHVSTHLSLLPFAIHNAPGPFGDFTPLYQAIVTGVNELGPYATSGHAILVVLTDGLHTDRPDLPPGSRPLAVGALSTSRSHNLLVFAGNDLSEPGALELQQLAAEGGADFFLADPTTRDRLVAQVLDMACANHAPLAFASATPNPVYLGDPGFTVTLDGTASHDHPGETSFGDLTFRWQLYRPGGAPGPAWTGTGFEGGAIVTVPLTTEDFGVWTYRLEVDDNDGGVGVETGRFEVLPLPPPIDLYGGGMIDVLDDLVVGTVHANDSYGRPLTFWWRQLGGPRLADAPLNRQEIRWTTSVRDVTMHSERSDHASYAPAWLFELTVEDADGQTATETVQVEVRNLPVVAEIDGPTELRPGGSIELLSLNNEDPKGGAVARTWDVVQSPQGTPGGATYAVGYGVSTDEVFRFVTGSHDAGTWIFRLNMTDEVDETTQDSVFVLVSAPPEVHLDAPERIGSLTSPLVLDAGLSLDPDTPCEAPDHCHVHLEGRPHGITPPILRWTWTLIDAPPEHRARFPTGGLEDVLETPASGPLVELPPATLPPGWWTFQLEVEDGEEDTDDVTVQIEVVDESGDPVAVVTPPRRHILDALNVTAGGIVVSSVGSFDPDNIVTGDLPGITARRWSVTDAPPGCDIPPPAGSNAVEWRLFESGTAVDVDCHGVLGIEVTVVDDDVPVSREATARTSVLIGNCPAPLCIDAPNAADPLLIEPWQEVDVPIFYHVDSALRHEPAFAFGVAARLEIFHADEPSSPVHSAFAPNLIPPVVGSPLAFHWTGHHGVRRPRPGLYHVQVSLVNAAGEALYVARENNAIAIAETEDLMDCGSLWLGGFPDDRDGPAFPCVRYDEPFRVSGTPYEIYHPPYWEWRSPGNPRILRWTAEAVRESWEFLATLAPMPEVAAVISPLPIMAEKYDDAFAAVFEVLRSEPCPLVVYPLATALPREKFKQVIAHEMAHCLQNFNFYPAAQGLWWQEGTAEFLSNLVYPDVNFEHRMAPHFRHDWPVYEFEADTLHAYATAMFYQALANDPAFGVPGVMALMGAMATDEARANPAAALGALPGMAGALHRFAQRWFQGPSGAIAFDPAGSPLRWSYVEDTGGGWWPARAQWTPLLTIEGPRITGDVPHVSASGSTVIGRLLPFAVLEIPLDFRAGWVYRIEVEPGGAGRKVSVAPHRGSIGPWELLPEEVRPGCRGFRTLHVVATDASPASSPAGEHELRITIHAERDPACP
jgi:Mg-chelatase subunit ChlD